jgi:hypothetical protein
MVQKSTTNGDLVGPMFGFGRPQMGEETEYRQRAAPLSAKPQPARPATAAMDLTDKPKAWLLIGRGGSGKTVLARWMGWRMTEMGRAAMIAALDPTNRSLATWFAGVEQPELSDPSYTARWLRSALSHLMAERASGVFDFGGGDISLRTVIDMAPALADDMIGAGVEPVACYCIGPSQDDLTSLGSLEESGFQPRSTLLVLNEGKADSMLSREEAFTRVLRHSDFRAAIGRGALPVWMPRLEPDVMDQIEGKHITFGQARDGQVPEGKTFLPIGGLERSMVGRWLDRMEQAFQPIATWLP